jgi:hypothetical protein
LKGEGNCSSHSLRNLLKVNFRERNKVLARKTREKKKNEMEFLTENLAILRRENERLKSVLHSVLPPPFCAKYLLGYDVQLSDDVAMVLRKLLSRGIIVAESNKLINLL